MILKYLSVLLLMISLLFACQPSHLGREELNHYIRDEDNGLLIKKIYEGAEIKVSYKPTDLLILQENGWSSQISEKDYLRLKEKYEHHYYFNLNLSKDNKELVSISNVGPGNYSTMVETLSFRMGQFSNLTTSQQDTISVADYVYVSTYNMSHSNSLLFSFPKDKVSDDQWIQFNLKEFGLGLGNLNFRFDLDDINNTPNIKFQEFL